jgi:hypothetical protein
VLKRNDNDTFAFLHLDKEGRESYCYTIKDHSEAMCLIDERIIAVTERKLHRIALINL